MSSEVFLRFGIKSKSMRKSDTMPALVIIQVRRSRLNSPALKLLRLKNESPSMNVKRVVSDVIPSDSI